MVVPRGGLGDRLIPVKSAEKFCECVIGVSSSVGGYISIALKTLWAGVVLTPVDRHRGRSHPRTPATPPCVRVRTRRFESVTLASINQRWKSERFEVGIRKPHGE